jgi:hypothetical protein
MTDAPISPLRRRMIEDMTLRKLAARTQGWLFPGQNRVNPLTHQTSATALAAIVKSYAHLNRSRIDLPITQSLSSSDRNDSSSVKWVMRCL